MFTPLIIFLAVIANVKGLINTTVEVSELDPKGKDHVLPMEVHKKIYSYTKYARAFKNMTFEQTVDFMNDLYAWQAPSDIQKNFPYTLWGYDYERRPVWIHEVGRQDWRSIQEQGRMDILEKYFVKCLIHVVQSLAAADKPGDEIRTGVFIWDLEGFSMRQIGHFPTVASLAGWAVRYGDVPLDLVGRVFIINSNFATKLAADIARPLLGRVLEKVEIYGTNRNSWLPRILKTVPLEVLPPWYGGNTDATPVAVYG
ncbi:unnamed protein product [Allacma fusca]|uniref:CRAL-TRIO domain-containing protein n=1 Tax=Allacma fusca TaxID=39272 RepID=A0A8J2L3T3_9HEXA|nr:unnamed protein product [Allacma fusca]